MDRRDVLKSAAALAAAWAALLVGPVRAADSRWLRGIDAHTHVFNKTDIPWIQFIWQVQLRFYERATTYADRPWITWDLFVGLTAFLTAVLVKLPEPILERGEASQPLAERGSLVGEVERLSGAARAALEEYLGNPEQFAASYFPPFAGPLAEGTEARNGEVDISGLEIDVDAAMAALKAEIERAQPELFRAMADGQMQGVAQQLLTASGPMERWLYFGLLMVSPRADNLLRLINTYAGGDDKAAMFAPSLVDFSGWLDGEPVTPLPVQIDMMHSLQQSSPVPVHMLAPFNPWRHARHLKDAVAYPSAVAMVEDAVLNKGAIGVKMYPPMGFFPADNVGKHAAGEVFIARGWTEFDERFVELIDQALNELYEACVTLNVPILAHAHRSNEAGVDFGLRSSPQAWLPVFDAYPTLRVCAAHFGAFDQQPAWEQTLADFASVPNDNFFADFSYQTNAMAGAPAAQRQSMVDALRTILASSPLLGPQLVYGSDWHMLAKEPRYWEYPANIQSVLKDAGVVDDAIGDIFRANTVRLFGLETGGGNYKRLKAYYDNAPRDRAAEWAIFDALVAPPGP